MESSSDNFDYIFQLTKVLSAECRASRQESDKIESILRRLAKQSGLSYDQLSDAVSQNTRQRYDEVSLPDEADRLILENYNLIYQIELQEYLNRKIWSLIQEIVEHLNSIRGFVVERKMTGKQTIEYYLQERFDSKMQLLQSSNEALRNAKNVTREKLSAVYGEVRLVMQQIDWKKLSTDSREGKRIFDLLAILKESYGVDLIEKAT